jgi:hypothetical protein
LDLGALSVAAERLLSLFGRLGWPFLVPAKTASAVARSRGQGRPLGRRAGRACLDGGEHGRTLAIGGMPTRTPRASHATAWFLLLLGCAAAAPGHAAETPGRAAAVAGAVQAASIQFGVPVAWIEAVIAEESGGDPGATSLKGAMGLMQLMPGTWRELSAEFGLGDDAFDRQANIIAGTAYLRRMYDRFGPRGFLAAYNAGPARHQAVLDGGQTPPAETLAYVARVEARIARAQAARSAAPTAASRDWRRAGLFVGARRPGQEEPDPATLVTVIEIGGKGGRR